MNSLTKWKAESGWDNPKLNAKLATDKNGSLYTTNLRSIYYDLDHIPDHGVINFSINVFTEYCFRILLCGTRDSRNPMEKQISEDLWESILFHVNFVPVHGDIAIEPYFHFDDGDIIANSAAQNRAYQIDITIDHNRRLNGDAWIGMQITNPGTEDVDVEFTWFNPIPESEQYLPAQIKLVSKSQKGSRNIPRTYLKSFSIEYDDDALASAEENTDLYLDRISNSVFKVSNMDIDGESLTITDLINNINVIASMTSAKVLFPVYQYDGRDVYDETDIKNLYNGEDTSIMKYPDVPENIKAAAAEIAEQTNSRDKIVKYLLSLCENVTN